MNYPAAGPQIPQEGRQPVSDLIQLLKSRNGAERQAARERLVEVGPTTVPALVELLNSPREQDRWEAAKALVEIPDARSADALVARLNDSFSIRWLASEALVNIGEPALVPLIHGLLSKPDAPRVRDSAHHVLTGLKRATPEDPHVAAMLEALAGPAQTESVPWVARDILKQKGLIPPE